MKNSVIITLVLCFFLSFATKNKTYRELLVEKGTKKHTKK